MRSAGSKQKKVDWLHGWLYLTTLFLFALLFASLEKTAADNQRIIFLGGPVFSVEDSRSVVFVASFVYLATVQSTQELQSLNEELQSLNDHIQALRTKRSTSFKRKAGRPKTQLSTLSNFGNLLSWLLCTKSL